MLIAPLRLPFYLATAALLALPVSSWAECKGPVDLETRARSTRDGSGYSDLGRWFGEKHQYACANQAFRTSLHMNPRSAKVNYFLGFSLYSSGQKEAALIPLTRSSELDPSALEPHFLKATVLRETGRAAEAEAEWKAMLVIDPASRDALDGLSKSLLAEHDPMAAVTLLVHARGDGTSPLDEELTLDLASAYGEAGMLDEAAGAVKESLARTPASLPLTKALATIYVHQHRYQDATELLRQYLAAHPADREAEVQYLSILVLTNDATTARPLGKKLLASGPRSFEVLYLNGILEREAQEYAVARSHLTEAVKLKPDSYTARYNLGAALAHLDENELAREQLQQAIALDPSQPEAHFQLAAVLRSLQQTQAAQAELQVYDRLKKEGAAHTEAESDAEQARQKLAAGDTAAAVELYRQAVKATPGDALLQYQLGLALDQAGDTAGERAALEEAVTLDPTFALAQNQLGVLGSRSGDQPQAETRFREAVKSAPGFTGAWINLAATLAAEGQFDHALEAVSTALKLEPANAQAVELKRQLALAAHK